MALNASILIPAPSSAVSIAAAPAPRVSLRPSLALPLTLEARLGSSSSRGGAGLLERPGFDQSQTYQEPSVEEGGEMGRMRQRLRFGGGDRYRVLLLDHQRHTEPQVAAVLPKVVPSVTPDEARKCFHESRVNGVGVVTVTVKEHAEFYAQMMARSGLRSSIEPDGDTI